MLAFVLRHRYSLINLGIWIVFGWLVYLVMRFLLPFVVPLLIGALIAILIEPVVKMLRKVRLPRWIASLTTLIVFFGGAATLLLLLAAKMAIELSDFVKKVPDMSSGLMEQGQELLHQAINIYGNLSPAMSEKVRENLEAFGNTLGNMAKGLASSTLTGITQVPTLVTIFIISLLISYFISKDFPKWQRRLMRLINPSVREKGDVVMDDLGKAIFGYIRAQAILISITFAQSLLGLLILQVEYAFSLALLAGLLDILPLLGTGSLFVPWAIYMLVTGNTKLGIGLLIVYGLIVAVRQVLEARILAGSIGLDPLVTIIAMYAGYQAIGFLGVLLAPFLIIMFTSLIKVKAFDFLVDPKTNSHTDNPPKK